MALFSERLKQLRDAYGVSQQELADYLFVNKQTISGYERGVRRPSGAGAREIYEKLADYFNVDISYLMGLSDVSIKISDPCDNTLNKPNSIQSEPDNIPAPQPPKTLEVTVTEAENKMLKKFRKLDSRHKEAVNDMIVAYYRTDNHVPLRGQMSLLGFEPNRQDEDEDDD